MDCNPGSLKSFVTLPESAKAKVGLLFKTAVILSGIYSTEMCHSTLLKCKRDH